MRQVSCISLRPEDVDAVVFWSKNPTPLLPHLDELDALGLRYYFQFTVNDYPAVLEPDIPSLEKSLETFHRLSTRLGPQRVIWRYDPIIISNYTSPDFHRERFSRIASALSGYTRRVIVAFTSYYQKTERRLSQLETEGFHFDRDATDSPEIFSLLADMAGTARSRGIEIFTCAGKRDFSRFGLLPGSCIDGELLGKLWSLPGYRRKDPGQRSDCRCVVSRDIGMNDSCLHGCLYCYATRGPYLAQQHYANHDPESPVLWGNWQTPHPEKPAGTRPRLL